MSKKLSTATANLSTTNTTSLCAIYARYSSHNQNDASIEQQVAECTAYAQAHNLHIVEIYADRAMSGRSDRRPEFQKMIRHAESGKFSVVVTYKSNRIARNMLDALRYEERLDKAGVKVVYCKENFGDNAAGRLALRMMMSLNEFYSENLAEDVKRGLVDAAKQGNVVTKMPYGYKKGNDGKFAIDEPRAAIVREIYERVASGDTLASISADLNARGIKTGSGSRWGRSSYHTLLSNERYTGVYMFSAGDTDVRIEGGIPAIIDRQLFDKVQEKRQFRSEVVGRRRDNSEYLLTGKAYCGECGSPMVGISGTSHSGAVYHYYVCKTRREQHACTKSHLRQDIAEGEVARRLNEVVFSDAVIDWLVNETLKEQQQLIAESPLAMYQEQLATNEKASTNLMKAVEDGMPFEMVKQRLLELENERTKLSDSIADEQAKLDMFKPDEIRAYLEGFKYGNIDNPAFKKVLFRTFLVRVYFWDDRFKAVFDCTNGQNSAVYQFSDSSYKALIESPESAGMNKSVNYGLSVVDGLPVLTCELH